MVVPGLIAVSRGSSSLTLAAAENHGRALRDVFLMYEISIVKDAKNLKHALIIDFFDKNV